MVCQIYARLPDKFFSQKMRHKMRECAVLALLCYAVDVVVPKTQTDGRKNSNTEKQDESKGCKRKLSPHHEVGDYIPVPNHEVDNDIPVLDHEVDNCILVPDHVMDTYIPPVLDTPAITSGTSAETDPETTYLIH